MPVVGEKFCDGFEVSGSKRCGGFVGSLGQWTEGGFEQNGQVFAEGFEFAQAGGDEGEEGFVERSLVFEAEVMGIIV